MPRYVILTHDYPFLHWDLMLEDPSQEGLCTWRLHKEPNRENCDRTCMQIIPAEQLSDHRKDYLTYEGPVSNNRGSVSQWDSGTYELLSEENGSLEIEFDGIHLQSVFHLIRNGNNPQAWQFVATG